MSLKDKLKQRITPQEPPKEEALKEEPMAPTATKTGSMRDRIRMANQTKLETPSFFVDNGAVALLLDDSSSMEDEDGDTVRKIDRLNEGVRLFADEIDFLQTKVTAIPFNAPDRDFNDLATMRSASLRAAGGTPMAEAIKQFRSNIEAKQGILISDGEADSSREAIDEAKKLREPRKRVDCVHIGTSTRGESTLKEIAEITGGMFFKFRDIQSFAASLRELAPKRRAALASKTTEEIRLLTGASEVIK